MHTKLDFDITTHSRLFKYDKIKTPLGMTKGSLPELYD